MKIVVTSDWHLDAVTAGFDRFDDIVGAIEFIVQFAEAEKIDLFVFLGDLCDPDANRSPRCVAYAVDVALRLSNRGIASRWLVGNHDVIEDGSGSSTLEPLEALRGSEPLRDLIRVVYEQELERIGDVAFVWLPYVPRCASYDAAAFVRDLGNVDGPIVVGSHLSVRGLDPGSETHDMPRGRDLWLPLGEIAQQWGERAFVLNGHYHKAMLARHLAIPGSPARMTFSEEGHPNGFLLLEWSDAGAAFSCRSISVPSRQVVTLPGVVPADDVQLGALVRVKPALGMSAGDVDALVGQVRARARALKVLPPLLAPSAVVAATEKIEPRRRVRDVIDQMLRASEGVDLNKDAVAEFMNRILDAEGI